MSTSGTHSFRTRGGRPSVFNLVKVDARAVHIRHIAGRPAPNGSSRPTSTRSPVRDRRASRCPWREEIRGCEVNDLLAHRLKLLGLRDVAGIRTHTNRTVMVSLTTRRELRLHKAMPARPTASSGRSSVS